MPKLRCFNDPSCSDDSAAAGLSSEATRSRSVTQEDEALPATPECSTGSEGWVTAQGAATRNAAMVLDWLSGGCGLGKQSASSLDLAPLLAAALEARDTGAAAMLLARGADPAARSVGPGGWKQESTLLHVASARCAPDAVALLLQAATGRGSETSAQMLGAVDGGGRTPAALAEQVGCPAVVAVLNVSGAGHSGGSGNGSVGAATNHSMAMHESPFGSVSEGAVPTNIVPPLRLRGCEPRSEGSWSTLPELELAKIERWLDDVGEFQRRRAADEANTPTFTRLYTVADLPLSDITSETFRNNFLHTQIPAVFRSEGSEGSPEPPPWQVDPADWTPSGLNRWLGPALAIVNDRPNAANIGLPQRDLTVSEYVMQKATGHVRPVCHVMSRSSRVWAVIR